MKRQMKQIGTHPQQWRHLSLVRFKDLIFWDYQTHIRLKDEVKHRYEVVRLKEVVRHRKEFLTIDDAEEYKRCKVQLRAKGIVLRDVIKGSDIVTKRQQTCRANELLVAEIDAKVGGYGIVPAELENAIVSSHYFLYEINQSKLLPEFLGLYLKTNAFAKQVQATGSTNYAAIRPYHVLEYRISLPPLNIQKEVIERYKRTLDFAEDNERQAKRLERETEKYVLTELGIETHKAELKHGLQFVRFKEIDLWGVDALFGRNRRRSYNFDTKRIVELCKIGSGGTPSRSNRNYYGGDILWVKTSEVVNDVILGTEEKITLEGLLNSNAKIYPKGSLIIAMYGQGATRGRTAKLGVQASTNQACAVLYDINSDLVDTDFLWIYLQSEYEGLRKLASGNNQPNLNAQMIASYVIPLPSLSIQKQIVSHVSALKSEIKRLKATAEALRRQAKDDFEAEVFDA